MAQPAGLAGFGNAEAQRDGALASRNFKRVFQHFPQKPQPVLERAAVFVASMVNAGREKVAQDREIMCGVRVENVIACSFGARRSGFVGIAKGTNVGFVHRLGLHRNFGTQDR